MFCCFATTSKGLEELLATELANLGAVEIVTANAGVQFNADMSTIMKANLHSRLASRIMLQLVYSGYRNEKDIYNVVSKVNWSEWFSVTSTIKVATNAIRCPLKSLDFVTLTVKDAICDSFVKISGSRPSVGKIDPDMRIYNFLTENTVNVYLDTSGEGLFKRGYRHSKLDAPIKENLAAGLIQLANWDSNTPFYDPMCGSGTIVAEAVSLGLNLAPGLNRHFAFEKFDNFMSAKWQELKSQAKNAIKYDRKLNIYANDINNKAVEITKSNFEQLGILDYVKFDTGDFLSKKAPETNGTLITNPPYGIRQDEQDELTLFYPKLGDHLKSYYANWNCYFFTADLRLAKLIRLKPSKRAVLYNGSLECRLFEFKMVARKHHTDLE